MKVRLKARNSSRRIRLIPFIWNFDSRKQAIFAKRATLSVSKKCSTNVGSFDLLHNTILIPVTSLIECSSLVSFLDERVREISRTIVSSHLGAWHSISFYNMTLTNLSSSNHISLCTEISGRNSFFPLRQWLQSHVPHRTVQLYEMPGKQFLENSNWALQLLWQSQCSLNIGAEHVWKIRVAKGIS